MATRPPSALRGNGDVDHRAGRRAAATLQHFFARQHQFDRPPALLRQARGDGFAVDGDLAAEATANLERHHLQFRSGRPSMRAIISSAVN